MLPSKGYFKALECPYYTESFCDRPYCHFKHSRQDFLSDMDCQIAAETENNYTSFGKSKLPEESILKPKVKSKIIEYVPQCIKSKNTELNDNPCIYDSATVLGKKESDLLEYIPSRVNEANLNFKFNNFKNSNVYNKEQIESINYIDNLSKMNNISEKAVISEYILNSTEKPTDSKPKKKEDKHHHEHKSSSKRKYESSRSSSESSSKLKKSKKDKSSEHKKDRKEQLKEEKCKKHSSKSENEHIKHNISIPTISFGPKSLKEVVMEKVKKKLVEPHCMKTDFCITSNEGNDLSTELIESALIVSSGSEDSGTEQKTCNVVEAKVKKRISHISTSSIFAKINASTVIRPRSAKSLHEMVANRVQSIQNNVNSVSHLKKPSFNSVIDPSLPSLKTKSRIAHQPKIESASTESSNLDCSTINNKEITVNVKQNLKIKTFKSSNNMPNPLRQSCLEKLYSAFINHFSSEEAIAKALYTEEEAHSKAKSSGIYRNLIVQSLMKANKSPELQVKINSNYPSHMYGVCLYELLKKYILSKDDLEKNGYPIMGENNLAYISKNAHYYRPLSKKRNGDKFVCMNCKSEFEVDKRGMPIITLTKCVYHTGKLKFERSKNEKFWLCCYKRQHESGCETSIYHMPDKLDEDALEDFVITKDMKCNKHVDGPNFYALDCEMVNTTVGIEIVRVTVINHEGKEVYESKVKPLNPILDYKSKYSGITEESLKHCSKRLLDIQLDLMKFFNKDSILIGHSLESDLKALKMVHYNVVDTSIIYPHKYGLPYKWSLKLLSEQHLQRIIQSEEGHDSKEDALASLDLVWKKLKEDVKKFKPVNIISIDKR